MISSLRVTRTHLYRTFCATKATKLSDPSLGINGHNMGSSKLRIYFRNCGITDDESRDKLSTHSINDLKNRKNWFGKSEKRLKCIHIRADLLDLRKIPSETDNRRAILLVFRAENLTVSVDEFVKMIQGEWKEKKLRGTSGRRIQGTRRRFPVVL